ncbi:MAG: hypothetical protein AAGF75_03705, partial [Cyanobacteria bacterium P01_H01_bin.130]
DGEADELDEPGLWHRGTPDLVRVRLGRSPQFLSAAVQTMQPLIVAPRSPQRPQIPIRSLPPSHPIYP